ncbi:MAG: SgcJ/EcaC family oxidoreductase [Pseudomonadota bacterium]
MDAKSEFQSLFDAYVERYLAGDAEGAAEFYTSDATIFSPFGPPVTGNSALIENHREWFEEKETNKKVEVLEARAEGDTGFCSAQYSANIPQEDGSLVRDVGTSVNTFERQQDGAWKIKHTSLNPLETED